MIHAVIFDLGDVLVEVNHRHALAKRELAQHERFYEFVRGSPLLHRFESGGLDAQEFFAALREQLHPSIEFDEFCGIYCDIFAPIPEMIEANAALRRRGMRTYLFSNTSPLHFDHIKSRFEFMRDFDGYFLSYELRCMKPHMPIYEAVEKGTGRRGKTLLYIDDRVENVEAGAQRGWCVIHHVAPSATLARLRALELL